MSSNVNVRGNGAGIVPASSAETRDAIHVTSLDHFYGESQSIRRLSISVDTGTFTAIIGPSGCGKTTFLNILAGLEPAQPESQISVLGQPPKAGRQEIGYGPARDSLLPWRRALDNAALALEIHGMPKAERRARARAALQEMGLRDAAQLYPAQLSQGMRQRVALARLFASEPQLMLLDEPFSALDAQTRVQVQDAFLSGWERTKSSVLLITHDLGEAITLADVVVVLTRRPASVKAVYPIDLPRPRNAVEVRQEPHFHELFEAIWADLQAEVALNREDSTASGDDDDH